MMNQQCSKCIWSGQCYSAKACNDYYPALDEEANEVEAEGAEQKKDEFSASWTQMLRSRRMTA